VIVRAARALLFESFAAYLGCYMANMVAQAVLAQVSVAHSHTMKTSALTIRLDRALDRQLAMLAKRLGIATCSKGFPEC
jgi:hypothetical protein